MKGKSKVSAVSRRLIQCIAVLSLTVGHTVQENGILPLLVSTHATNMYHQSQSRANSYLWFMP